MKSEVVLYSQSTRSLHDQLVNIKEELQNAKLGQRESQDRLDDITQQLVVSRQRSDMYKQRLSEAHHHVQELEDQLYELDIGADDATSTSSMKARK